MESLVNHLLFAFVWVANLYMAVLANLRLDIRHERLEIKSKDLDLQAEDGKRSSDKAA